MPLPYTDVNEKNEKSSSDEEMDVSMISLKYLSETEAESPKSKFHMCDSKLFPPVENYRKAVGKRYTQHFSKKFMH